MSARLKGALDVGEFGSELQLAGLDCGANRYGVSP